MRFWGIAVREHPPPSPLFCTQVLEYETGCWLPISARHQMGTVSSSSSSPSPVVVLKKTKIKTVAVKAPQAGASTLGLVVLCDSNGTSFDAPPMRRISEAIASKGNIFVLCLGLPPADAADGVSDAEALAEAAQELRTMGALRIGICGFGTGADVAMRYASQGSSDFAACAAAYPTAEATLDSTCLPTVLVLAGLDEGMPKEKAISFVSTLRGSPAPGQIRNYRDQGRGFVEAGEGDAAEAAVDDVVIFMSEHLAPVEHWRVGKTLARARY